MLISIAIEDYVYIKNDFWRVYIKNFYCSLLYFVMILSYTEIISNDKKIYAKLNLTRSS